jgi:hypothetical protein
MEKTTARPSFSRHYWILDIQDALAEQIRLCIGIRLRLLQKHCNEWFWIITIYGM